MPIVDSLLLDRSVRGGSNIWDELVAGNILASEYFSSAIQTISVSHSEASSASDGSNCAVISSKSALEIAVATSQEVGGLLATISLSEVANTSDLSSTSLIVLPTLIEPSAATDSPSVATIKLSSSSEAINAVDSYLSTKITSATLSESSTILDVFAGGLQSSASIANTTAAVDSSTVGLLASASRAEVLTLIDSQAATKQSNAAAFESSLLTESGFAISVGYSDIVEIANLFEASYSTADYPVYVYEDTDCNDNLTAASSITSFVYEPSFSVDSLSVFGTGFKTGSIIEVGNALDVSYRQAQLGASRIESASLSDSSLSVRYAGAGINEVVISNDILSSIWSTSAYISNTSNALDLLTVGINAFAISHEQSGAIDVQIGDKYFYSSIVESGLLYDLAQSQAAMSAIVNESVDYAYDYISSVGSYASNTFERSSANDDNQAFAFKYVSVSEPAFPKDVFFILGRNNLNINRISSTGKDTRKMSVSFDKRRSRVSVQSRISKA